MDIDSQMLRLNASELADMILQEATYPFPGSTPPAKSANDSDENEPSGLTRKQVKDASTASHVQGQIDGATLASKVFIGAKLLHMGGKAIYNKLKKKDVPQMPYGNFPAPQQHYVPYQQLQFHGVGQNQQMPMDGLQHTQVHQMQYPRMQQMQVPMHYNRY